MTQISAPYLIYLGNTEIAQFAKTGQGLVHWRPERCLAQLRETGCQADLGLPDMTIKDAVAVGAKTLVIGTTFIGGQLPDAWIARLSEALEAGLDIAAGLHQSLASVPQLRDAAARNGRAIHDVRVSKKELPIASGKRRTGNRLLAMGTDCAVGKKYSALAIHRAMEARGMKATFRATGQTGVLIDGTGIAADAIVSDFLAGAVEQLTPAADADHWDVIEGQGSLIHPAYSGVTLGLLHGAQPNAFVVCHEVGREELSGFPGNKTGQIEEIIALTMLLGERFSPDIKCVGLCLNTSGLTEVESKAILLTLAEKHGVAACDPVRFGVNDIVQNL
ncbi:DUF1611 domain-containing protein [Parasedimentitalea maritima]|uniref:DUF1611 domain-containing protein n=1 Tax=Parasedimentitalea maritima TaxID=2578117 RepID=A0ABY2USU3_9RHOB|nr:DUF1611 domain-containing protein [Zongyanglinia marina]TLP55943.1 DUF1611 domain-containing protein [Zongyanglinia marina]